MIKALSPSSEKAIALSKKIDADLKAEKEMRKEWFGWDGILSWIRPETNGTPPKQYGQWLQSTGRQKWNKKKKK